MKTYLMHKAVLALALLLPLAGNATYAQAAEDSESTRVAHFTQLTFRESPFGDLRGACPLSPEKAKTYKHYRFVYDQKDRVIEISFRHGDAIQVPNISRTALFFTPVVRIEYSENKETRTFFDRFMNPANADGTFREEYDLDEDGNRTELRYYDFETQAIDNNWAVSMHGMSMMLMKNVPSAMARWSRVESLSGTTGVIP